MRGHVKFALSSVFAMLWLGVSVEISMAWMQGVSQDLPAWYAAWVIIGIALLPGYLMSAMFISNMMNTQLEKISCEGAGDVCVIVCARNEQATIYDTIECIAAQKYCSHIKIICVDNASVDSTGDEIRRAARAFNSAHRRVELMTCTTPGKFNALNMGLGLVDTKYFITVDADTMLAENSVCALLSRIKRHRAGCAAGNLLVQNADTLVARMQIYDYLISIAAVKRYQGSYNATLVAQGAFSAYDTAAVKTLGGWRSGAGEDIVLTYRLLSLGLKSVYEPQAVGYTVVPDTLMKFCRQRVRWATGMFEGIAAVRPWQQPSFSGGYFETLNLSIVYLDLAYVFGFMAGALLCAFGITWFVGWQTLMLLPALLLNIASVYVFQHRITGDFTTSWPGFVCFILLFQPIQSICSLAGYVKALFGRRTIWK